MKIRKHIDWNTAFISYCTPFSTGKYKSYTDIAKELGVTVRTVERQGSIERWVQRRCEVGISKTSKYLRKHEEVSIEIYKELKVLWILMLKIYRDHIYVIALRETTNPCSIKDLLYVSRGLAILTDQTLKLFPKINENQKHTAPKDSEIFEPIDTFLGI